MLDALAPATAALWLAGFAGAALIGWMLFGGRRARTDGDSEPSPYGFDELLRLGFVSMGVFVVQAGLGIVVFGIDAWGLMSVLYLDAVLVAPALGLSVLVAGTAARHAAARPLTWPARVACLITVGILPVGWYTSKIAPFDLRVDEVVVEVEAAGGGPPLRIGVIADIQTMHVGDHERRAVALLMAVEPDLVLFAGDVFQGTPNQYADNRDALRDLFSSLEAPLGSFVVPGDVDTVPVLESLAEGTSVEVLADEIVSIDWRGHAIVVAGMPLERTAASDAVLERVAASPHADLAIVLAHRPDWVYELPDGRGIDLLVAGHTHGGQLALPLYGPLVTLSSVPRDVAAGGLHQLAGQLVYVSPGVGREQQGAPQVRFLAPPSVGVLVVR